MVFFVRFPKYSHTYGEVVVTTSIGEHLSEGARLCLLAFEGLVPIREVEIGGTILLFYLFNLFINLAQIRLIIQICNTLSPLI